MNYIITNTDDDVLAWSNEDGWVSETFDTFTEEERLSLNLPIGGEWRSVRNASIVIEAEEA